MSQPRTVKVAPSLLAADFARLKEEIELVERAGADLIHIDVMDGHFVPNITIGPCVVAAIDKVTKLELDVHLMITAPDKYLAQFAAAGSNWITFHIETSPDPEQLIAKTKSLGVKVGVSLKPKTPVAAIADILPLVDLVLVMSVEPGFGGQEFMPDVLSKVSEIRRLNSQAAISIDGGINGATAPLALAAGVDILVAGSAVFNAPDPAKAIRELKNAAK